MKGDCGVVFRQKAGPFQHVSNIGPRDRHIHLGTDQFIHMAYKRAMGGQWTEFTPSIIIDISRFKACHHRRRDAISTTLAQGGGPYVHVYGSENMTAVNIATVICVIAVVLFLIVELNSIASRKRGVDRYARSCRSPSQATEKKNRIGWLGAAISCVSKRHYETSVFSHKEPMKQPDTPAAEVSRCYPARKE